MQPFSEAEIEFFIETNGRLSAQRALALGTYFVSFVEEQEALGDIETIEIVHLGRGSFRARLMVILRDPATATLAAMGSLALAGAGLLRQETDHEFAKEVAGACIDSGASRCGFRTADTEFLIEREDIPAVAKVRLERADSAKSGQIGPKTSQISLSQDEAGEYRAPIFQVEGIFDIEDGLPRVRTIDRGYPLAVGDGELPPQDRLANFELRGPSRQYGDEYTLEGWVLLGDRATVTLTGRMVERHGGRAVTFETADQTFTPIVPDDTLGWVPMGALVEVKGFVSEDNHPTLTIFTWRELDEPKAAAKPSPDDEPSVDLIHDDAAPLSLEELSNDRNTSSYSGELHSGSDGLEFKGFDGRRALIDGLGHGLNIPNETPIEIDATLRRGSRGGMGDPRLIIWNWRPIDDVQQLSGRVFTGTSGYVFHTEDGRRLSIVGHGGGTLPTAEHLLVFARFVDAPREQMAEASIEILDWRRIDE